MSNGNLPRSELGHIEGLEPVPVKPAEFAAYPKYVGVDKDEKPIIVANEKEHDEWKAAQNPQKKNWRSQ